MHKNHHNAKFANELIQNSSKKGALIYFPSSREQPQIAMFISQ